VFEALERLVAVEEAPRVRWMRCAGLTRARNQCTVLLLFHTPITIDLVVEHKVVIVMSKVCQVTGKRPLTGMNVSHSHIRTKRRTEPNLHAKRLWLGSEKRWVRLRVSAHGMRIIDKRGVETIVAEIRARGDKV
jgi:large subunit ribosomal protein L28